MQPQRGCAVRKIALRPKFASLTRYAHVLILFALAFDASAQNPEGAAPAPPPTPAPQPVILQKNPSGAPAKTGNGSQTTRNQTAAPTKPQPPAQPAQPGQPPAPGTPGKPEEKAPPANSPPSDTPLESVVPTLPNEITDQAENVPENPDPVMDELPEGEDDNIRLTMFKKGRPIEEVIDEINKKTGIVVHAMENAKGQKIDLRVKDKTVKEILDEVVLGKDMTWIRRADGTYEVWDKPSFIEKELRKRVIRRVFPLRYVNVTDVQSAVEGVKSDVGAIAANPRTNELIITDLPDKVALIGSILKEIDVQLYTRTFRIKYAKFDEVQERLPDLKSPAGMIQVDAANRLIIVTDTFEKIKQIEQLIMLLDIDQPIRIYHLNSIGLEAADAEDLIEDIIKPLATEDALIQFNETQSTLIVKDVAEVHDRILEVLNAMDRTPKQIWIEGEVLLVSRAYKFEFGTEWSYSGNLDEAIAQQLIPSFGGSSTETSFSALPKSIFPIVEGGGGGLTVMNLTGNLKMQMDALMSDDKTRILLQPRALVRNGEEVGIDITQENPQGTTYQNTGGYYPPNNGTGGGGFNTGYYGSSIQNVVTGLTLSLTPTISNRGLIEMEIDFENSTPDVRTIKVAGEDNTAVARNSAHIQTVLIIPSGETRVLGGLISRSSADGHAGIPFLSKIPWVGWLFGKTTKNDNERNLLFFLTPTIVEERPEIDLVEVPVNAAARAMAPVDPNASMEIPLVDENGVAINPVPEDLMPYLRQENPELESPLNPDQFITPDGATDSEPTTPTEGAALHEPASLGHVRMLEAVEGMLRADPSVKEDLPKDMKLTFSGPGADLTGSKSQVGPVGTIGPGGSSMKGTPAKRGPAKPGTPGAPGQPKPGTPAQPGVKPQPGAPQQPGQQPQQAPVQPGMVVQPQPAVVVQPQPAVVIQPPPQQPAPPPQ